MALWFPLTFQPQSLQQRTTLFVLLPTLLILLVVGSISLLLVREALLDQWQQMAIAKLEKAAHQIDMRLLRPKRMLMLFQEESGVEVNRHVSSFILEQLRGLDGVVAVNMEWDGQMRMYPGGEGGGSSVPKMPGLRFHRLERLDVTTPAYDAELEGETVSLITEFWGQNNEKLGQIEVVISFYDLIGQIVKNPWWKTYKALLVDHSGNVLTRTSLAAGGGKTTVAREMFGVEDQLEIKTLAEMQNNDFGTVFGPGMPPTEIAGFYRLTEAPWTMVIVVPGKMVLAPIIEFRAHFALTGTVGILLALLLIRSATGKTTSAIKKVSTAANELANGIFGPPLLVTSRDEVGELTRNFNIMTRQLMEGMQLQEAMNIAHEVQQKFLPQSGFSAPGMDISGVSIYCQETGGDYFDLLPDPDTSSKVNVVVGDVVGHGIGAALLMATIRALLRSRIAQPGRPVEVIGDVNRLLCQDTSHSGNFITLFYLIVDGAEKTIRWVRCGHEPAVVYCPGKDVFSELKGDGIALGVEADWRYSESCLQQDGDEQIILIGSDGVWDVENAVGEQFGRERVKNILARTCSLSSQGILQAITDEISFFRGEHKQADDITLVIVKIGSELSEASSENL